MSPATETTVRGRVNWFNTGKGLGFIERFDGGEDVYVWHENIIEAPKRYSNDDRKNLYPGQIVEFEVVPGHLGKPAARRVRVITQ
jgi:cold shock CspA family protein